MPLYDSASARHNSVSQSLLPGIAVIPEMDIKLL